MTVPSATTSMPYRKPLLQDGPPVAQRVTAPQLPVLALAFLLSGVAALIYQVLWTRMLGHVFGVTVQAASTVLACFMAGLAIGSAAMGRWADRLARPLLTFAVVELLIGITAVLTPSALTVVQAMYAGIYPAVPDSVVARSLLRLLCCAAVLLIPTSLMGMTFPLVVSHIARRRGHGAASIGMLYGLNTCGAIVGTLGGGLWLVPAIGVAATFRVAAAINALAAAAAWLASGRPMAAEITAAPVEDLTARGAPHHITTTARRVVLVVMAVSGFVSLTLEIVWFRVLVFFVRPTTYGFASMLATVLLGLALGSLLIGPRLRDRRHSLATLGLLEIGIAISTVAAFAAIPYSYSVMESMFSWRWLPAPLDFVLPLMGAAAVAILPPTLLLGAAFPIGILLWTDPQTSTVVGRRVGLLYALNVGGGIFGALAGGFLLIPTIGAQRALVATAALALAGGLALLFTTGRRVLMVTGIAGCVVFLAISWALPELFTSVIARRYRGQTVLWHRESAQSTVTVTEQGSQRTLLIDGMVHAVDGPNGSSFHRLIGTLGLAIHPNPQSVLVIGLGGGTTTAGASSLPSARVDVVELSDGVIDAAPWLARGSGDVTHRPNVHVMRDDGRNHLWLSGRHYDVTTADLLLPEMAGAADLNSVEYFRLVARALTPDGIAVQWIPSDSNRRYRIMARTFATAFPYVTVWAGGDLWVGSLRPIAVSRQAFEAKLQQPGVRERFAAVGLTSFEALLRQFHAGDAEARRFVGTGPIVEDDWPVIEYFLTLPKGDPAARTDRFRSAPDPYVVH